MQNTGGVAGHEVSQLYLDFPAAYAELPKLLRGFARTLLNRGQRQTVRDAWRSAGIAGKAPHGVKASTGEAASIPPSVPSEAQKSPTSALRRLR
ncbi:hypothetical protein B0H17DRAFT_1218015 [Mycena rosella]|uniref:Fibronectin type III-like domain-containing protein n=1 Tax=Mycena rosella TaxID=1033263 RepID=A0AAD7BTU7_MYCRO|nr:hypothetical protein B0H17DRAFT_1218015 [Mycena rosella]